MFFAHCPCAYIDNGRPRDAIECYKRALISANPNEININLKLANLYGSLQDHTESVAYHRRVIEVSQANGPCLTHIR